MFTYEQKTKNEIHVPTGEPNEFRVYRVDNMKGRGVYLYVSVCKIVHENGFTSTSFSPFDDCNFRGLVLPLKRKSQKQIDIIGARLSAKIETVDKCNLAGERQYIFDLLRAD